jgi:hypothetical protein
VADIRIALMEGLLGHSIVGVIVFLEGFALLDIPIRGWIREWPRQ